MQDLAIGIDFGTSNTAAAVIAGGKPRLIPLEPGKKTLPTALFLDYAGRRTLYGSAAVDAMIEGRDGRFMRALKSILGTGLARERRPFLNERLTPLELVARFLTEIRTRAEAATGARIERVVAGRPVHFHSADPARDAQAAEDLAECYRMAGFRDLRFLNEPEAAALAAGPAQTPGLGLIVDIGGGTSDFTLFRPQAEGIDILSSRGLRLGGTDFDKALSLAHVMPLLGLGGELRNELGPGRNDVPPALYHELAAPEKIAFVYGPEALRDARRMARLAVTPERLKRLVTVLEMELGHDIAFAVEAAKIAANQNGQAAIRLDPLQKGLQPPLGQGELLSTLWPFADRIGQTARATVEAAGYSAGDVGRVIFVGGSSLVGVIDRLMRATFPAAAFEYSEVFTAVADGLAIAAGQA